MRDRRFTVRLFGAVAALMLLFGGAPAVAQEASAAGFTVWRNQGLSGYCLANHHPAAFMHFGPSPSSAWCGRYNDQLWSRDSTGMVQNLHSGKCLATHGGGVFTSDCNSGYRDQRWVGYPPEPALLENRQYPGMCLAAHANGNVFISPCNPSYADQYWSY
ncbi:ricin-type beta-trefoil lectin domain protein [Lentzea sp. JNUCC 0626]|uniref:RICIN domain-containing protein n=1 Tax=Lentzea sp. JNUCC 0626 TaxID=3367513 RepID=UPI00374A2523